MNDESGWAEYYETHKDDPEIWDEPLPARPRRRLASMISVRLSADEVQAIRQAAEERGVSVSAFLRATALVAARHRDSAPTTDYPVIAYADSCTRNVSNAEVTVLTGTSLQDIGQVGGTGLAMQSTTIADH